MWGIAIIGLRFLDLYRFLGFFFFFFFFLLGFAFACASWPLAPLAGAIDRCSIRFKTFLSLQLDVTLDYILLQWYLQELAWLKRPVLRFLLRRYLIGCHTQCRLLATIRCRTLDVSNIPFVYAGVIVVLKTWYTEDVPTE